MPDPKAPANDPRHPNMEGQGEHFTPEAVAHSVELAGRIRALMDKHTTPTERDPGPGPDLAELERREELVLAWHRDETQAVEITDCTGELYSYGETAPGSGEYAWERVTTTPIDIPTVEVLPDAPAQAAEEPQDAAPDPGADEDPEAKLSAALAALDAKQGA